MLRSSFSQGSDAIIVRLEGHFAGNFAEHARQLLAKCKAPSRFVADLSAISYIDAVGEEVLILFKEVGMKFKATSAVSRHICERLQLPLVGDEADKLVHSYSVRGTCLYDSQGLPKTPNLTLRAGNPNV
jgi:hypothetical protein